MPPILQTIKSLLVFPKSVIPYISATVPAVSANDVNKIATKIDFSLTKSLLFFLFYLSLPRLTSYAFKKRSPISASIKIKTMMI